MRQLGQHVCMAVDLFMNEDATQHVAEHACLGTQVSNMWLNMLARYTSV